MLNPTTSDARRRTGRGGSSSNSSGPKLRMVATSTLSGFVAASQSSSVRRAIYASTPDHQTASPSPPAGEPSSYERLPSPTRGPAGVSSNTLLLVPTLKQYWHSSSQQSTSCSCTPSRRHADNLSDSPTNRPGQEFPVPPSKLKEQVQEVRKRIVRRETLQQPRKHWSLVY